MERPKISPEGEKEVLEGDFGSDNFLCLCQLAPETKISFGTINVVGNPVPLVSLVTPILS